MNIAIDIDGVIAEFQAELLRRLNEKHNMNLNMNDWTEYYFEDSPKLIGKVSRDDILKIMEEIDEDNSLMNLSVKENAVDVVNFLAKEHKISFITSRAKYFKSAREHTKHWLDKHGFKYHALFLNHVKHDAAKELNIDLFIEDHPINALNIAKLGVKVFLFNRPYNQNVSHENIIRVDSWDEIQEKIKDMNK